MPGQLTARELEITGLVARGFTNREVGSQLGLTEKTVKNHVSRILDKTTTRNRVALTNWAWHNGKVAKEENHEDDPRPGALADARGVLT